MGGRVGRLLDVAVVLGLVALVLLPGAVLAATPRTSPPPAPAAPAAPVGPGPGLTPLPVWGTAGARTRAAAALRTPSLFPGALRDAEAAAATGGRPAVLDLADLLLVADAAGVRHDGVARADRLLRPLAVQDCGAALTLLLARDHGDGDPDGAASAARAARRACPDDPTALFLQVQDGADDRAPLLTALRTLSPPVARVAEGDVLLRRAADDAAAQPFVARDLREQARDAYASATVRLPEAALGQAAADVLLGDPAAAVGLLRGVVARVPTSHYAAVRLAEALEAARQPAEAARVLGALPDSDPTVAALGTTTLDAGGRPGVTGSQGLGLLDGSAQHYSDGTSQQASAPAFLVDTSFVPAFRPVAGLTGGSTGCPQAQRVRDLVVAHELAAARAGLPGAGCAARPAGLVRLVAALAGPVPADVDAAARAEAASADGVDPKDDTSGLEDLQDVQREAGDLGAAAATTARWRRQEPLSGVAALRAGEVAFLAGRWTAAVDASGAAERDPVTEQAALLLEGGARLSAGRPAAALAPLDRLVSLAGPAAAAEDADPGLLQRVLSAQLQRGAAYLQQAQGAPAVVVFRAATPLAERLAPLASGPEQGPLVAVGLGLAHSLDGHPGDGLAPLRAAVAADPDDPLTLLDLAFVQRRTGDRAAAERSLREALELDPSLGLAALDLGTLLAQDEHDRAADAWLRRGLDREPHSAAGWHSLGVVLSRGGLSDQVQGQAALARAVREDKAFRGRERTLVFDEHVYLVRLDLGQPLPARWSFATQEQRLPVTALLGAGVVGLVGWVRERYRDKVVDKVKDTARDALTGAAWLPLQVLPLVGLAAAFYVLLRPLVGAGLAPLEEAVVVAGVVLLVLAPLHLRRRLGGPEVRHVTWTPALVLGLVGSLTGLSGFAPVPGATGTQGRARVHRAAPAVLFAVGLLLFLLATLTEVPLARTLATTALAVGGVCLTPADPFDGAHLQAPRAVRALGLVGTGIAVGLAVGVL